MSVWRRRGQFLYRLLQGLLAPERVSFAIFFLTDLCNARCPYCFNTRLGHFDTGHVPADRSGLLSVEEYEKIATNMKPLFQVVFGGGEPFLREDIDRIAEAFYLKAKARLFSIPTNGSLTNKVFEKISRMSSRCPDATFNLQVSLDAHGTRHDELRVLPGGFEKAKALCHRILDAKFSNVNLVINTAVTEHNIRDVEALQDFFQREFGADRPLHHVQFDQRLGSALSSDPVLRNRVQAIERRSALPPAARGLGRRLLTRYYIRFINALVFRQLLEDRMIYRCNAGQKLCVVMPDGAVSPCEPFAFDERYRPFPKFNVKDFDYDVGRIQRTDEFRKMRSFIEQGRCAACPWSCAAISSMTYSPRNWPLLFTTPSLGRSFAAHPATPA